MLIQNKSISKSQYYIPGHIYEFIKRFYYHCYRYKPKVILFKGTDDFEFYFNKEAYEPHKDDNDCLIIILRIFTSQILYSHYPSMKLAVMQLTSEFA